ncbi:MAG: hypothetical protein J7J82_04940 [Staphylothermus sp.]|nr:hypothetical protein [Staphylothermus sp.]
MINYQYWGDRITIGYQSIVKPKAIIIAKTINNKENHYSKENDFVITSFQTLYNKAIKENKLVI